MSEQTKSPSGSNDTSGSAGGENQDQQNQTVAYETHKKLLAEKKKRDEEVSSLANQLKELQAKERERVESDLKAKEDWKKYAELKDKEVFEMKKQVEQKDSLILTSIKRGAVKAAINGDVPDKYMGLIDVSKVVINPETGMPDPASVQEVARHFEQEHKLVILSKDGKTGLPNDAAAASKKMTVSEWNALGTSKEMKARFNDVDWNTQ